MKAGACDQCVLEMRCCNSGNCWCCDAAPDRFPTLLADLTTLLHRRPELADRGGWVGSRPTLAGVLTEGLRWGL